MTQAFKFRTALLVLLCSSGMMLAYAEDSTAPSSSEPEYLCSHAMIEQGTEVVSHYETFLNEYFQVDTPTSGLFESALNEYRFTEMAIQAIYQANLNIENPDGGEKTLSVASTEISSCEYYRDVYLNYIKTLFQRQYLGSVSYKVTFKVVDGLKAMNVNLDSLSELFGETFPVLFNKFNNGLACYSRNCASK